MVTSERVIEHEPTTVREVNQWIKRMGMSRVFKVSSKADNVMDRVYILTETIHGASRVAFKTPKFIEIVQALQQYVPSDWL